MWWNEMNKPFIYKTLKKEKEKKEDLDILNLTTFKFLPKYLFMITLGSSHLSAKLDDNNIIILHNILLTTQNLNF